MKQLKVGLVLVSLLLLIVLSAPSVASASWWNPSTWNLNNFRASLTATTPACDYNQAGWFGGCCGISADQHGGDSHDFGGCHTDAGSLPVALNQDPTCIDWSCSMTTFRCTHDPDPHMNGFQCVGNAGNLFAPPCCKAGTVCNTQGQCVPWSDVFCGTRAKNYPLGTTGWPSADTSCGLLGATPVPAEPAFPTAGKPTNWTCINSGSVKYGDPTPQCTATVGVINPTVYFTIDSVNSNPGGFMQTTYRQATIDKRLFDPGEDDINGTSNLDQIDPYSDIDCIVKISKNEFPTEQAAEDASFKGTLLAYDGAGNQYPVNTGSLKYEDPDLYVLINPKVKMDPSFDYFVWPILGWDDGAMPSIAPTTYPVFPSTNPISPFLLNNPKLQCQVDLTSIGGTKPISTPTPVNLCSHIWGNFKKRDSGKGYAIAVVSQEGYEDQLIPNMDTITQAMDSIDPFKTYDKNFEYYIDVAATKGPIPAVNIRRTSNCTHKAIYEYITAPTALQVQQGRIAYYKTGTGVIVALKDVAGSMFGSMFVRMLGHYFNLSSETYSPSAPNALPWTGSLSKSANCTNGPPTVSGSSVCSAFVPKYPHYFDNSGCYQTCTSPYYFRSTETSLMYDVNVPKFNCISCATILPNLDQTVDAWNTCAGMDIVKE